ncbi:mate-domain-containing protein [Coemansia spiralis]|nr:mate-domain-containing protein [Coemansia spiralis]
MSVQDIRQRDTEAGNTCFSSNEATPLLSVSPSETSLEILKRDTTESYIHVAKEEAKWIVTSSSLAVITLVLESSFYIVNAFSVGHLGATKLAAMTLSITCQGILAMAPTFGLLSAMDTFCSNAYTASRDKTLMGFHFQRGIIAVCAHFLLTAPILWNSEWLLLQIGQDPEIAQLSGTFLRIHVLSVLPFALFEATKRYLQAQGIMRAGTIVTMVVAPTHWVINYYLVRSPTHGLGFIGAPISNVISNSMLLIGIVTYMYNSRAMETWGGWKINAFRNMSAYYRLAIPAVITVCAEWVCFELLVIGASYFGATQMAGQAVMFTVTLLLFQFSNGLGYSISPRVGNLIGAAKPRQARVAADMAILASSSIGMAGTLLLSFFGKQYIAIYTDDPAVAREAAKLIPAACAFLVADGLNAVLSAILRGLGRQTASANIFVFGFYACAVPLGIYLGYIRHLETAGLWWGIGIGVLVSCALQTIYIYWGTDWKDEVRLCLLRLKNNSQLSRDAPTESADASQSSLVQ